MPDKKKPEHSGCVIHASMKTTAPPEQVWEAWVDPEKLAQWFPDRAEGRAVEGAVQTWYFDRFGYTLPYEVYSSVPGEHLVLTGEPPGRPRFFLEIEIARSDGLTTVNLLNSAGVPEEAWNEDMEGIVSGWMMALALLRLYVERYYGQPRSQFFVMRPATYEYEDLVRFYREPEFLARWLTLDGSVRDIGDPVALTLRDGQTITGEVLALTAWEVQLSWEEIAGAIAFKGFRRGTEGRTVCIHGSGWGLSAERAAALETHFEEAIIRLCAALR